MNGIGGRTIAEARENLSYREFQIWARYRNSVGSFNFMMRTEWAAGLVSSTIANVNRGKNTPPFNITDFTPHYSENPASSEPISLDEAMKNWG